MIRGEESLSYHSSTPRGKIAIRPSKPCVTPREMQLAYLPGCLHPAAAIAAEPQEVFRHTARGNLVGVVTDGSAVPGLGDVGPAAAKPLQEGMAVLFKRLADIDVFDLELATRDPDRIVETVRMLEPTFGAINLKDIAAPQGLIAYDRLREVLSIPVFHENLYGTAVVAAAALLNAVALAEKDLASVRVVLCGAGNVGLGCARLFLRLGIDPDRLLVYDVNGLLHPDRTDLHEYQRPLVRRSDARDLAAGLEGADVFVGASTGGVLPPELLLRMNRFPAVIALATPEPEITYDAARAVRRDVIVATSDSRHPNTVLDLLSFPYIFRGALDVQAVSITETMLVAASRALADLAREDVPEEVERAYGYERFTFGPEYLLPKPIDPRILAVESVAVAESAAEEGVAMEAFDRAAYEESLVVRLGTGRETLRSLVLKARHQNLRVVFADGANETLLRAAGILIDEEIAAPILVGPEEEIRNSSRRLGLDLSGAVIVDPETSPRRPAYVEGYFRLRNRHGVMPGTAEAHLSRPDTFAAMMLDEGDADMMVSGLSSHYAESLRTILGVIGPEEGVRRVSGLYMALVEKEIYFLADCAVNIDPDAETMAETALLASALVRSLGLEPRVAMLSFSNFGSLDDPVSLKARRACEIARARAPELVIDGEMQLITALDGELRSRYFPFSRLTRDANVLLFPDLQSGHLALNVPQRMGGAVTIGPVLLGTRRPVQLTQYGYSVEDVVNLVSVGVVQAANREHWR